MKRGEMTSSAWLSVLVLAVGASCGSGRDAFSDPPADPPFVPDASAPDPCHEGVVCSRDLRRVLDGCETKVIEECAPEMGCAEGRCVPACDSAVSANASSGCEFMAVAPGTEYDGGCFAAVFANNWATPVRIEAEYDGEALDVRSAGRIVRRAAGSTIYDPFDGDLAPGSILALFLEEGPDKTAPFHVRCPEGVTPAIAAATAVRRTGRGKGYRLRASAPVAAYSVYPFGGAESYIPSATLLLPIPAWKNDYVLVNAWEPRYAIEVLGSNFAPAHPTAQVVAAEDGTEITMIPSVTMSGGPGVEGADAGAKQTWHLARNEVLQFAPGVELTGSLLASNKPVALFGGHECMFLPFPRWACDAAQQQLFPVGAWGREYVAVPHPPRNDNASESVFWRIVGSVDETKLEYDPERPAGAPATIGRGQSVLFRAPSPFVVRSDSNERPFAVYAYMTGSTEAEGQDGDPEFVNVIATEQYLNRYTFYVDDTYPNSKLVVVRSRKSGGAFERVTLDCGGELGGWLPIGHGGLHEYTYVTLTKDFDPQPVGSGTCGSGHRSIDSNGPIAVTVWGTGDAASYAYPGGAAARRLNTVQTIIR